MLKVFYNEKDLKFRYCLIVGEISTQIFKMIMID